MLTEKTIAKYDILEQNIYNFDETGFQISVTSTTKIITDFYHSTSHVWALQSDNHEWVTVIEAVNASD